MEDIGIIGGADGPTAVLVASRLPWLLIGMIGVCVLAVAVSVLAVLFLKKK